MALGHTYMHILYLYIIYGTRPNESKLTRLIQELHAFFFFAAPISGIAYKGSELAVPCGKDGKAGADGKAGPAGKDGALSWSHALRFASALGLSLFAYL